MKKKTYRILAILILILTTFSFVFYKTFYTAHRDIASEKTQVSILASELQLNYAKDYEQANKAYADKVIETTGNITAIEEGTIVLDDMIQVDFLDTVIPNFKLGESLTVKGRCVGYDDLLEVVKIDQATNIIDN